MPRLPSCFFHDPVTERLGVSTPPFWEGSKRILAFNFALYVIFSPFFL